MRSMYRATGLFCTRSAICLPDEYIEVNINLNNVQNGKTRVHSENVYYLVSVITKRSVDGQVTHF